MKYYYKPINVIVIPSSDCKTFQTIHILYNFPRKIYFRKYAKEQIPLYYFILNQNDILGLK